MADTEREAFYRQARCDYEILLLLNREGAATCQRLHYLQMSTEKLSKDYQSDPASNQRPASFPQGVSPVCADRGEPARVAPALSDEPRLVSRRSPQPASAPEEDHGED